MASLCLEFCCPENFLFKLKQLRILKHVKNNSGLQFVFHYCFLQLNATILAYVSLSTMDLLISRMFFIML